MPHEYDADHDGAWDLAALAVFLDASHNVELEHLAQFSASHEVTAVLEDTSANRPAASTEGRLFFETDSGKTTYDDGGTWVIIGTVLTDDLDILQKTATLDPGSISAGDTAEVTATVIGATTDMEASASPSGGLESGLMWSAYVSSSDTVTIRLHNTTGASIDPASRDWEVRCTP